MPNRDRFGDYPIWSGCDGLPGARATKATSITKAEAGGHMRFRRAVGVMVSAMTLASCAQAPEEVRPAYISPVAYDSWTCRQLGEEQARLQGALTAASSQQSQTRANDV